MPFKSKSQMRYLWAFEPLLAVEFLSKTKSVKRLPERVGPKKKRKK